MTSTRAAHRSLLAALRKRELVVVESPLRGSGGIIPSETNFAYGHAAVSDSLARGEAPFASHLFYTQFLDDEHEASRRTGMMCGWAWLSRASLVAVYLDLGWSSGMREGVSLARSMKIRVEERSVPGWVAPTKQPDIGPHNTEFLEFEDLVRQTETKPDRPLPPLYQEPHAEEPPR